MFLSAMTLINLHDNLLKLWTTLTLEIPVQKLHASASA